MGKERPTTPDLKNNLNKPTSKNNKQNIFVNPEIPRFTGGGSNTSRIGTRKIRTR